MGLNHARKDGFSVKESNMGVGKTFHLKEFFAQQAGVKDEIWSQQ